MINYVLKLLKDGVYFLFFVNFIFQIKFLKIFNKDLKIILPNNYGFGDFLFICSRLISKLNKKKNILL